MKHRCQRALQAKQVSVIKERESDLATWTEDLLDTYGWTYHHVYEQRQYARRSTKGYPDYHAIGPNRTLGTAGYILRRQMVIELKSEAGKVSPEQRMWLDLFMEAGVETYLLRPGDRDEFQEIIVLGHSPNLIECSWQNRRAE